MSYQPLCSYWLYVSGDAAARADVDQLLRQKNIVPEYLTETDSDSPDETSAYHVDDNIGAICQWSSVEQDIGNIAASVKDAVLVMYETNEEDKSEARKLTWKKGLLVSEEHARVVDPGEYDEPTLDAVYAILERNSLPIVEKLIRDELDSRVSC